MFRYLTPYKKYLGQLFLGMSMASILSLIAPFLTQSMVDYGISQYNLGFIYLILFSQVALFLGDTAIEMIRSWILLHMSTRVNIAIISDFLIKLMKLPIRFFDTKMVGDITQRIADHNRIETFLTGSSLNTVFSIVNLLVFFCCIWHLQPACPFCIFNRFGSFDRMDSVLPEKKKSAGLCPLPAFQ